MRVLNNTPPIPWCIVYQNTLKASAFFGNFKLVGSNTSHIALKHTLWFAYLDQKGEEELQEQKQQHFTIYSKD